MTKAQQTRFYFPAWNAAFKARWIKDRGTIIARLDAPQNDLADMVEAVAARKATQRQGLLNADDLRHACHVVALGKDRSSYDLTNLQVDRVVALFELLADPENLSAQMRWASPDIDRRRRLEWSVKHCGMPDAYVAHICRAKFGTANWRALSDVELGQLVITLKSRAAGKSMTQKHTGTLTGQPPAWVARPLETAKGDS